MPDSKIPKVEAYETREIQFWKQGPTVEEPDPNIIEDLISYKNYKQQQEARLILQ